MKMTKQFIYYPAAAILFLLVSACGHEPGERAVSGGLIGAGVGAGAAALGASTVPAVLVGAGVGATAGALTSDKQIDLDE